MAELSRTPRELAMNMTMHRPAECAPLERRGARHSSSSLMVHLTAATDAGGPTNLGRCCCRENSAEQRSRPSRCCSSAPMDRLKSWCSRRARRSSRCNQASTISSRRILMFDCYNPSMQRIPHASRACRSPGRPAHRTRRPLQHASRPVRRPRADHLRAARLFGDRRAAAVAGRHAAARRRCRS